MKAITLQQPWAHLVIRGVDRKFIINKSYQTAYRGPLVIHAAPMIYDSEYRTAKMHCKHITGCTLPPRKEKLACDAFLGVVTLSHIYEPYSDAQRTERWSEIGEYGWAVTSPWKLVEPIEGGGHHGLWDPPHEVMEQIASLQRLAQTA